MSFYRTAVSHVGREMAVRLKTPHMQKTVVVDSDHVVDVPAIFLARRYVPFPPILASRDGIPCPTTLITPAQAPHHPAKAADHAGRMPGFARTGPQAGRICDPKTTPDSGDARTLPGQATSQGQDDQHPTRPVVPRIVIVHINTLKVGRQHHRDHAPTPSRPARLHPLSSGRNRNSFRSGNVRQTGCATSRGSDGSGPSSASRAYSCWSRC